MCKHQIGIRRVDNKQQNLAKHNLAKQLRRVHGIIHDFIKLNDKII